MSTSSNEAIFLNLGLKDNCIKYFVLENDICETAQNSHNGMDLYS